MTSVQLVGTDELIKLLKKALLNHKPAEVRKALKRGAMIIVNAAKANVHHSVSGTLKKSIKILPVYSKDPASMFVAPRVASRFRKKNQRINGNGITTASPFYAHWVEYGTAAHNLGYKGKFIEVTGAQHPGSKPKPYMRPAYDTQGQAALNVAMEDLSKLIESKA